jgi:hypothetical protein
MRSTNVLRIALGAVTVALLSTSAFAQKFEIHPYVGGFFPAEYADTGVSFKKDCMEPGVAFSSRRVLKPKAISGTSITSSSRRWSSCELGRTLEFAGTSGLKRY